MWFVGRWGGCVLLGEGFGVLILLLRLVVLRNQVGFIAVMGIDGLDLLCVFGLLRRYW